MDFTIPDSNLNKDDDFAAIDNGIAPEPEEKEDPVNEEEMDELDIAEAEYLKEMQSDMDMLSDGDE